MNKIRVINKIRLWGETRREIHLPGTSVYHWDGKRFRRAHERIVTDFCLAEPQSLPPSQIGLYKQDLKRIMSCITPPRGQATPYAILLLPTPAERLI